MLKVGQKVRVRKDLEVGKWYGNKIFLWKMKGYLGKDVIIEEVIKDESISKEPTYKIETDKWSWCWTKEMFEPICNKEEAKHLVVDDIMINKYDEKEYTFDEVTRIGKDGDEFTNINKDSDMREIAFSNGVVHLSSLSVNKNDLFIKKEKKRDIYIIYKVEHREGQQLYDFLSDNIFLEEGRMVICDTKYGKTYGRIRSIEKKYMTESEAREYKKCNILK